MSLVNLNTSNYTANSVYKLNITPTEFKNKFCSLDSLSLYNSIFNITAMYGNNNFKIKWIDGTEYNFIIPDSYLEYDALTAYIEQQCLLNNLYMTTSDGSSDNVFFFKIAPDLNRYKVLMNVYYVPNSQTATELGWTKPTNATWNLPTQNTVPQIWFNSGLRKILGFGTDMYYPQTTNAGNQEVYSDTIAKLLNVFCINVCCNLIDNKLNSVDRRVLAQIPIKSEFGSLITVEKNSTFKLPIRENNYDKIEIILLDQDYKQLQMNDYDLSCVLVISD